RFLIDQVTLIGTPHYACEGCEGPNYSSAIVVRHDSEIEKLHESVGLTMAFNEPWSQSGRGAWHRSSLVGRKQPVFDHVLKTGAHRASLRAVASGEADICAVDSVCWALSQRYDPDATAKLSVLEWTEKTPGLPVISHAGLSEDDRSKIQTVFEHVISNLDTPTKDSLMLSGFTRTSESDYRPLAEKLAQATADWDPLLGALSDKTSSSLG
ncbi:MAG: PhnD/SsuA/transferrin family substrate-binding protein, partial [Pseudomonadota bacterium]